MSEVVIFVFGLFVTVITLTAVLLTGLKEASDPTQTKPDDVAGWERSLIDRDANA